MLVFKDMFHCLVYGHLFDTGNLQGFHLDGILDEQQVSSSFNSTYFCDCDFNFAILMLLFVSEVGRNFTPQAVVPVQHFDVLDSCLHHFEEYLRFLQCRASA
mgnify:CR=1 FL=1